MQTREQLLRLATEIAQRHGVRWKLRAEEIEHHARLAVECAIRERARDGRELAPVEQVDRFAMLAFMSNNVMARRRAARLAPQGARGRAKRMRRGWLLGVLALGLVAACGGPEAPDEYLGIDAPERSGSLEWCNEQHLDQVALAIGVSACGFSFGGDPATYCYVDGGARTGLELVLHCAAFGHLMGTWSLWPERDWVLDGPAQGVDFTAGAFPGCLECIQWGAR